MGRRAKIGKLVMQHAKFSATVEEIVRATGAKPNTVRVVLHRAAANGSIHLTRFYRGRSARTIRVIVPDDSIVANLNGLICGLCGKVLA